MIVGFTGTRQGMTPQQVVDVDGLLAHFEPTEAHHGGCIGADQEFHEVCESYGIWTVVHWSDMPQYRANIVGNEERPAQPPLVRNYNIVKECDHLIATPKGFKMVMRSGTWATVRLARGSWKPYTIIYPDGTSCTR
jgi:hypothetical protein